MTQVLNTLDGLIQQSAELDEGKRDFRVPSNSLFFAETRELVLDGVPLPHDDADWQTMNDPLKIAGLLTDNARNQLYDKLATAAFGKGRTTSIPTAFLGVLPNGLFADTMNWMLSKSGGEWLVRFGFDQVPFVRAVLDSGYPRTYNTDILQQVHRVLLAKEGLDGFFLDRPFVNADDMFVRGWWDGKGTGNYRVGFIVTNGETGMRRTSLLPMAQRTSCENSVTVSNLSFITGNKGVGMDAVHRKGITAASIMISMYANMTDVLGASAKLINDMIAAEEVRLPSFAQILKGLSVEYDWDDKDEDRFLTGTEGKETVGGVVNGLTWLAQAKDGGAETLRYQQAGGDFIYTHGGLVQRLIDQGRTGKKIKERV